MITRAKPALWFRQSPLVTCAALVYLVGSEMLTATIRLGIRDESNEKGYALGEQLPIEVRNRNGEEDEVLISKQARLTGIAPLRLQDIKPEQRHPLRLYHQLSEVQADLSFFEKRRVELSEMVTIVTFEYCAAATRGRYPGVFLKYADC